MLAGSSHRDCEAAQEQHTPSEFAPSVQDFALHLPSPEEGSLLLHDQPSEVTFKMVIFERSHVHHTHHSYLIFVHGVASAAVVF